MDARTDPTMTAETPTAATIDTRDLPAILAVLNDVTDRMKVSHDRLEREVVRW